MDQLLLDTEMETATPTEITPITLRQIRGRMMSLQRLSDFLEARRQDGDELSQRDLGAFIRLSNRMANEDCEILLGTIDSLIRDSEKMIALLQVVASTKPEDFDEVHTNVLEYLAAYRFF